MPFIPDETELRVFKLYLPYVLIIVQGWMIFQLSQTIYSNAKEQVKDAKQTEQTQREEKYFWRNSFLDLVEAYQKLPDHENEQDSSSSNVFKHPAYHRRQQ